MMIRGMCCMQAGSQYRKFAEPAGQMQNGKWVSASNKAGLTLRFENSGGKPPGPYCRDLDQAPAEGEVCDIPKTFGFFMAEHLCVMSMCC